MRLIARSPLLPRLTGRLIGTWLSSRACSHTASRLSCSLRKSAAPPDKTMEQVLDLGTLADVTFTVETSLRERDYRSLVNFPLTFSPSAAAREILCPFRKNQQSTIRGEWRTHQDSNLRPPPSEGGAHPAELWVPTACAVLTRFSSEC